MDGGPGEDDRIASAHAADDHPLPHAAEPGQSRPAATPPASPTASEWTVSDRRGPLNAASARDDDVERFVPGSETDAEGAHDPTTSENVPSTSEPASTFAPRAISSTGSTPTATTIDTGPAPDHVEPEHAAAAASGPPIDPSATADAASAGSRRSVLPLAIAVVIGALLGAGSAALVYSQLSGPAKTTAEGVDGGRIASISTRVDGLERRPDSTAALAKMKGQVDDLATKMAALEARASAVAPTPAVPAIKATASATPVPSAATTATAQAPAADGTTVLNAKIVALQASVDALQKQNGSRDLAGKIEALQASLAGVQTLASNAHTNVDALKSQQQAIDGKLGDLRSAVGTAQQQASAAKSGVDVLQSEQKNLAGKLGAPALAVVADSLVAQIASGKPYATQVDALASLGADPVQVALLRQNASTGVPSSQVLLGKFAPLVDPITATGSKAPANANFGERLRHGLFGLVNVRRTDVTTGNDLSSRVALIQSDLTHDDVAGAYAVWSSLPADAKQVSEAWGASTKTCVEAITAARGLQTQSIGSLAAKKS